MWYGLTTARKKNKVMVTRAAAATNISGIRTW
jgi:hypothetical protein